MECIEIVVNKALYLQHFFPLIDSALTDHFGDICRYFTVMCFRDKFNPLELEFDNLDVAYKVLECHSNQLAKFKQLTKIRLSCVIFRDTDITIIGSLENHCLALAQIELTD